MNYLLGSGYYKDEAFAALWLANNERFAFPKPNRTVVISLAGQQLPFVRENFSEVELEGNPGHIHAILSGAKNLPVTGWSSSVLALALIAYCNETDLIYKESDCLAFGNWVTQMYADLGEAGMVFGGKHQSAPYMPCSQSLFLVRHSFLLKFVELYLSLGDERKLNDEGKPNNLSEDKFVRIQEMVPDQVRNLTFGVDRERPLPVGSYVWYGQHFTPEELQQLKDASWI